MVLYGIRWHPQEIFNSPYAVTAFRPYSEPIPGDFPTSADKLKMDNKAESLIALSEMAEENGVWLIGGMYLTKCNLHQEQ